METGSAWVAHRDRLDRDDRGRDRARRADVLAPEPPGSALGHVLDERVRRVLERLECEDADERARGLPSPQRARQVARTTGQFLFALVAPQTDCEVLEVGGSRGYSAIWLAAGGRVPGGRVLSPEHDLAKIDAWRPNIADPG